MKPFKIFFWILLVIALVYIGYKANEKDKKNRNDEYNKKQAAIEQSKPQKIVFPSGDIQNPIQLEEIISKWKGEYYINPGDSLWFNGNPRSIGYQTKFSESNGGKFSFYRGLGTKPLVETFNHPIPNSASKGITKFCIKNTGTGSIILYAWWGYKSVRDISLLGSY